MNIAIKIILSFLLSIMTNGNFLYSQSLDYSLWYFSDSTDFSDSIPFVRGNFEIRLFGFEQIPDSLSYTSFSISEDTLYLFQYEGKAKYMNSNSKGNYLIMEISELNQDIIYLVYTYPNGTKRKLKYRIRK